MKQVVTQTLYRKYRPQNFSEVIGQEEVTKTLEQQIAQGSIAHAYLFSGGRGTGKTSIARIFAHELDTSDQDIYEIDAASNRGINEIRQLRDGVTTMPFYSRYKVYIIDEVHMLTKEAFNALLKTLEEPPAHVIFILATTEKNKVLDTILSRCQVYDFKLANSEGLKQMIRGVVDKEGYTIDDEALAYVASLGKGSFRDTLSHLQKILATNTKSVTYEEIKKLQTGGSRTAVGDFFSALAQRDGEALIKQYEILSSEYRADNFKELVDTLIEYTRPVLLMRHSRDFVAQENQYLPAEEIAWFTDKKQINSHTLRDLLELYESIVRAEKPQELFEVFVYGQIEKWGDDK